MAGASGDLRVSMKAVTGLEHAWPRDYANSSDSVVMSRAISKRAHINQLMKSGNFSNGFKIILTIYDNVGIKSATSLIKMALSAFFRQMR
jgi:hypothetical protein